MKKLSFIGKLALFLLMSACGETLIPVASLQEGSSCLISTFDFAGLESIDQETASTLRLNWTNVAEAHTYLIMDVSSGSPNVVATVASPTNNYTVSGLSSNSNYKYKVQMIDENGNKDNNNSIIQGSTTNLEVPQTLSGIRLWLRSDNFNGSQNSGLSDGDSLASWSDNNSSSVTVDQSDSGRRPTFHTSIVNGHSVARFNGSDQFFDGVFGSSLTGPTTIFVVGYFSQANQPNNDYDYLINFGAGAGAVNTNFSLSKSAANWGSGNNVLYSYDGAGAKIGPSIAGQAWTIFAVTFNNSSTYLSLHINGSSQSMTDYTATPNFGTSFEIGRYPGDNHYLNGDVAEVLVYDNNLGQADRETIQCYLASRYSISIGHACN